MDTIISREFPSVEPGDELFFRDFEQGLIDGIVSHPFGQQPDMFMYPPEEEYEVVELGWGDSWNDVEAALPEGRLIYDGICLDEWPQPNNSDVQNELQRYRSFLERAPRRRHLNLAAIEDYALDDANVEQFSDLRAYIGTIPPPNSADDGKERRMWDNLEEHGVFGDREQAPTYLTTDAAFALAHARTKAGSEYALIELAMTPLLDRRNVYPDPEAAYYANTEAGRTFLVMGGIPSDAIMDIHNVREETKEEYEARRGTMSPSTA